MKAPSARTGTGGARSRNLLGPILAGCGAIILLATASTYPHLDPESILELYDLSTDAGEQVKLPGRLQEISGLATSPDGRLFGHDDERAVVYEIDPFSGEITKAFGVGMLGLPGDFEGIAIAGERFFLLTSSGTLLEFREGNHGSTVRYRQYSLRLEDYCEMEGLAFDPGAQALLMPCKNPRFRDWRDYLVVLVVPLATMTPELRPRVFLPLKELDKKGLGDDFHPSAIEFHPETGSMILVAAREEALAEIGPGGEVLAVEEVKKKAHPQPEGIAFLKDGTLVLADEGRGGRGTLTRYSLKEEESGDQR
jgi:uncharacterized protein YjiK